MSGRANGPGSAENGEELAANAPGPIAGVLVSAAGPEGHACAAPNIAPRPARFVSGARGTPGESPQRWSAMSSFRAHEDTGERETRGSAISTGWWSPGEVSSCLRARARLCIAPGKSAVGLERPARSTPRDRRRGTPCSRARRVPADEEGYQGTSFFSAVFGCGPCRGRRGLVQTTLVGTLVRVLGAPPSLSGGSASQDEMRDAGDARATRRTSCPARWS